MLASRNQNCLVFVLLDLNKENSEVNFNGRHLDKKIGLVLGF